MNMKLVKTLYSQQVEYINMVTDSITLVTKNHNALYKV